MAAQTQLVVVDGRQRVLSDGHAGTVYALAVRVDGVVSDPNPEQLGPAISALYGQTLAALLADRTLGGLVCDVAEGGQQEEEPTGLELDIGREAYSAPVALSGLHLTLRYWQSAGAVGTREAILEALTDAVARNTPLASLTVRERILVALHAHLAAALGSPILRNATRPQQDAAVVLVDGDQAAFHDTLGLTHYRLAVALEVFRPHGTEAQLDGAVQALLAGLRSAGTLGGLAIEVEEGTVDPEVLRQEYTGPLLAARIEAAVWFGTVEHDPTRVAS